MKTRKNIRDVFKNNSKEAELETAVITSITTYPTKTDDFYVFFTYSGAKKISFTNGEQVV